MKAAESKLYQIKQFIRHELTGHRKLDVIDMIDELEKILATHCSAPVSPSDEEIKKLYIRVFSDPMFDHIEFTKHFRSLFTEERKQK